MLNSKLYQETVLKPQFPYLTNTFIYEYDLSKANISSLRSQNIIDDETYRRLYFADRMTRQIQIGLMLKENKELGRVLKRGIIEAKKRLFDANNINDWEILCVKNDAIFIIGRELQTTQVGDFYTFNKKNTYTMFMQLCNLEIYYYDRFINGELSVDIDVKGINDSVLILHEHGMLELICEVCSSLQRENPQNVLSYLTNVYNEFINRKLPIEYYREFDSRSKYRFGTQYSTFFMDYIRPEYIGVVDINRNLLILRDLISIVSSIYMTNSRQ